MKAAFLGCAAALVAAALPAQTVKTLISNGPTQYCYDMVILGDGYRAAEQAKFDADCLKFAQGMFLKEPYLTYQRYVNVHTVFRASNESGADHPDANPPIVKDTVYDASYNTGNTPRCLYIKNQSLALRDAALAPANEGRVLVMVNDSRYGGCAGTFAVSYNGAQMVEVQVHEIGHSIGQLADEYWYSGQRYTGSEPGQVNATKSATGDKWQHWRGFRGVSAFEGCRYHQYGLWRPANSCLMRVLGVPLCPVCSENIVRELHKKATGIVAPQPATSPVTVVKPATQAFSFNNRVPTASNATITWKLDGNVVATGTASWTLQSAALPAGPHTVALEVQDRTALVRQDPAALLRQTHAWTVDVRGGASLPDLQVTDLRVSDTAPPAGGVIRMTTTVANHGNIRAGAHAVELFLSTDATITAADTYLGSYPVGALDPSQSATVASLALQLPTHLPPGSYRLGAWVDRLDQVREFDETNNVRTIAVTLGKPACGAVLEFRDPLTYPYDAATLHLQQTGDDVQPTVVAPCRAGSRYVIAWGCSGTQPGTNLHPIGQNLTLPLNLDACTQLGLGLINTTSFTAFFGTLDGNGIGRATFRLPGVPYAADLNGHFAAVILDPSAPVITAVSNPVAIAIRR